MKRNVHPETKIEEKEKCKRITIVCRAYKGEIKYTVVCRVEAVVEIALRKGEVAHKPHKQQIPIGG